MIAFHENLLHSSDLAVFEPHLDAVRMKQGISKKVFYHAYGSPAGSLVLF